MNEVNDWVYSYLDLGWGTKLFRLCKKTKSMEIANVSHIYEISEWNTLCAVSVNENFIKTLDEFVLKIINSNLSFKPIHYFVRQDMSEDNYKRINCIKHIPQIIIVDFNMNESQFNIKKEEIRKKRINYAMDYYKRFHSQYE